MGGFSPANGFGQPASETAYPQENRSGNSITSLRDIVLPLPLRIGVERPGLLLRWLATLREREKRPTRIHETLSAIPST
ncbi:MAG: hypothetical protein H0Z34_06785 [Brevibacillus sp.]|nr:hypothetical protein [Brevibacillus sp.]